MTNVMTERPKNNNFGEFYEDASRKRPTEKLQRGISRLHSELQGVSPNIIIACGAEPLRALTGKFGINKWRGSVLWTDVGKVIACSHPAAVLRAMELLPVFKYDLGRSVEESRTPKLEVASFDFVINPSFSSVMKWLEKRPHKLAFDIETQGERVRCIALADSSRSAICIPFSSSPTTKVVSINGKTIIKFGEDRATSTVGSHWTLDQEWEIINALDALLTSKNVLKIAQNFKFDATHLTKEFGIIPDPLYMDTMIAQHCCYIESPKSLDFLCSIYTKLPRYSDHDPGIDYEEWKYNCMDACVTFEVSERLDEEMTELKMWPFYTKVAQPLMYALARAGNRGIRIDVNERRMLKVENEQDLEASQVRVDIARGGSINPNSSKQMKDYLYTELGLKTIFKRDPKTRKMSPTCNEDALYRLSQLYPKHQEFFDAVIAHRGFVKTRGYLDARLDHRGYMITSYNPTGTNSGRISSSKTLLGEYGENLQQVRKSSYRRMYVPPIGFVILKADLSQAESRATAWFAKERELIDRFCNDPSFDIHVFNAAAIYACLESLISYDQREAGKKISHSSNYMVGAQTAARNSRLPLAQVRRGLSRIRRATPELKQWWIDIEREVIEKRYLKGAYGRVRIAMGRIDENTLKSYVSFKPQNLVGDKINIAFTILELEHANEDRWPMLQVHDEIVMAVRDDDACIKEAACLLKVVLEEPIQVEGVKEPLIIPAEVEIGANWWDTVEYDPKKNYEGEFA